MTPRHAPGAKCLHHCILFIITFDLICNMTMFVQNGFWTLWGHTPLALALPLGLKSKLRMCSWNSHPKGYRLWKFQDFSLNGLGAMVWHYRRMDVRTDGGYHNIPAFSPKSLGIMNRLYRKWPNIQTKMYRLYRKMTIIVIFLYNL